MSLLRTGLLTTALCAAAVPARAGEALEVIEARLDPPTLVSLGVQVLVSGDDDGDATIRLRYRPSGGGPFREGLPLVRVRPEVVRGRTVPRQFAGSIFNLRPDSAYDLELLVQDPDRRERRLSLTECTRPAPRREPRSARTVPVRDAAGLRAALAGARAGDVIQLARATYAGTFVLTASGTADDPVVLRGEDTEGTVLDGGGATGNVLEVYGSFVHLERMTLKSAERGIRFQGTCARGNVLRRVHIRGTCAWA